MSKSFYVVKKKNGEYYPSADGILRYQLPSGSASFIAFMSFEDVASLAGYGDRVVRVSVVEEHVYEEGAGRE